MRQYVQELAVLTTSGRGRMAGAAGCSFPEEFLTVAIVNGHYSYREISSE